MQRLVRCRGQGAKFPYPDFRMAAHPTPPIPMHFKKKSKHLISSEGESMHSDDFLYKKQKPIFTKRFQIPLSGLPYECPSVPLRAIGIHFPSEERSDIFGCTRNQRFRFGGKSINVQNIKSSGCLFELIAKKCQNLYVNQYNGMIRVG